MLWLLDIPAIELLFACWLTLMLYTAIVTVFVKINTVYKVLIIPLIFFVAYQSMIMTEIIVGTPSYSENETQGNLSGYVVFEKNNIKQIAVLLNTKQGPMLYAIPYDPDTEKNLSQAMSKLTQKGVPTLVRKKGNSVEDSQADSAEGTADENSQGQGTSKKTGKFRNQTPGPLEFYDFVDQYLVPKGSNSQQ